MRQARYVHRVVDWRGDGVALAGDQRRSDGAAVAGQNRTDTFVDRLADRIEKGRVAQPERRRRRRRLALDGAERVARGADAHEIHVACEIVAARPQRRQRRRQMRLERDKATDRRRGALAHRDAHALRRLADAPTFDALDAHGDAVAALTLLAHLDKARKWGAPD